jgi:protein tyrosine phosphatase
MTFTEKATGCVKNLVVYSISNWGDHQANIKFNERDYDYLRIIYKTNLTATHCSAGLGRAGTIAFAMLIASKFKSLQKIVINMPANSPQDKIEDALAKKLFDDLVGLREKRPGLIQTSPQLKMAVDAGMRAGLRQVMLETEKKGRHQRSTSGQQPNTTTCRTFITEEKEKPFIQGARYTDIRASM